MRLQRPLKDAIDAGARAGPGVKAIPTVKSKKKTLAKPPAAGVAATRAAEAKKKAAERKAAPSDLGGAGSAPEEPAAGSQAEKESTSHARERFPRLAAEVRAPCRKHPLDEVDLDPYVVGNKHKMGRTHTSCPDLPSASANPLVVERAAPLQAEVG
nr:uncharacterized protein LOC127331867 [Lolium perenne]